MSAPQARRRPRPTVLVGLGVALAGAAVAGALLQRDEAATPGIGAAPAPLPASPAPALEVPAPRPLGADRHVSRWSPVVRSVTARKAPSGSAPARAQLETTTPEQTANVVPVFGRAVDESGALWVQVGLPVLPNGTTGWVPRDALGGYGLVRTRLVVDLERLTATLLRNGESIFRAAVGVGRREWPTPTGEFLIRNRLSRFSSPFYGPLAFGTSARSSVLTDWPAGGFVGIHGTNQPELLPGRVSHGCIRMRNRDIVRLARLMPVGTPVTIR
jgi:lipoprotein-anchoring transpeptidase ErfK/SrfK